MIEVVNRIKEAETAAEALRKQAASEARDMETAAHAAGRELLERSKRESAAKAEALLSDAEKRAEKLAAEEKQKYLDEGKALAAAARGRLDDAASLIVERIVKAI